jgi:Zn-dependent protease/CBS domain-containing protein
VAVAAGAAFLLLFWAAPTGGVVRPGSFLAGLGVAAALLLAVALHAGARSLAARRHGAAVPRGAQGTSEAAIGFAADPPAPRDEALIAASGLLVNAALAVGCGALWWAMRGSGSVLEPALRTLAAASGALLALYLLPAYPLDGGQLVRAFLRYLTGDVLVATDAATFYSTVTAWCLLGGALALILRERAAWGVGLLLCGCAVLFEAGRARRETRWRELSKRVHAAAAAFVGAPRIPATCTLDEASGDVLEGIGRAEGDGGGPAVVVDGDGRVIGILGPAELRGVARARWAWTTAGEAMAPREGVPVVPGDATIAAALALLAEGGTRYALVLPEGEGGLAASPLGPLTRERAVRHLLRLPRERPAPAAGGTDRRQGRRDPPGGTPRR